MVVTDSRATLAFVPTCAGKCRHIRGNLVGDVTADPDLWDFCGARASRNRRLSGAAQRPSTCPLMARSAASRPTTAAARKPSPAFAAVTGSNRRPVTLLAGGAPIANYLRG